MVGRDEIASIGTLLTARDGSIGGDANPPMESDRKKQHKPLNDLSRLPTPSDPNQMLIAVVELSWLVAEMILGAKQETTERSSAGAAGVAPKGA